jgi:transcriptional regulator with XRE-family HTH domain
MNYSDSVDRKSGAAVCHMTAAPASRIVVPEMLAKFEPRLDILPDSQRRLWPELDAIPSDFVLYGGTGLALQLGHRVSEDFDFFSSSSFDAERLRSRLPFFKDLNPSDPDAWVHRKRDNLEAFERKDEPDNDGFPQRLSALRKERSLTQQALADMVELGITQMKRYKAGSSQPTLEVIRKLSQALRVSADELLFGKTGRGPDEDLRLQFEAISRFNEEEKKVVRSVLEGLLLTHEARRWSNGTSAAGAKENTR